jgi:hypothetical protein
MFRDALLQLVQRLRARCIPAHAIWPRVTRHRCRRRPRLRGRHRGSGGARPTSRPPSPRRPQTIDPVQLGLTRRPEGLLKRIHWSLRHCHGRPGQSPSGAPGRSSNHSRTRAATCSSDASGWVRRCFAATICMPKSVRWRDISTPVMFPLSTAPFYRGASRTRGSRGSG